MIQHSQLLALLISSISSPFSQESDDAYVSGLFVGYIDGGYGGEFERISAIGEGGLGYATPLCLVEPRWKSSIALGINFLTSRVSRAYRPKSTELYDFDGRPLEAAFGVGWDSLLAIHRVIRPR